MKKAVPSQRRLFNSLNRVRSTLQFDHEGKTCLKGPDFNDSGFDGFHSEGFLCLVSKDDRMFFRIGFLLSNWFLSDLDGFVRIKMNGFSRSGFRILNWLVDFKFVFFRISDGFFWIWINGFSRSGFRVFLRLEDFRFGFFRTWMVLVSSGFLISYCALTVQRCSGCAPFHNLFDKGCYSFVFQ